MKLNEWAEVGVEVAATALIAFGVATGSIEGVAAGGVGVAAYVAHRYLCNEGGGE